MGKKGSIMIFVLLTFMLISSTALLVVYMAMEQMSIENKSVIRMQSQYFAESKINRAFYDNKYFDKYIYHRIINHNVNTNYSFVLEEPDLLFDTNGIVNFRFYDLEGQRIIELIASSDYKGKKVQMKSSGPIYNEIFYDNNPALSYKTINPEHIEKFQVFMDEISDKIDIETFPKGDNKKSFIFSNVENVIMEAKDSNSYYISSKDFKDDVYISTPNIRYNDELFLIIRNDPFENKPTLFINEYIYFRGIIYLEGDLVINSNFRFLGLIIVNGNIIIDSELESKPLIEGALASNTEYDPNDWDLKYQTANISKYGIYLPNFIEPRLKSPRIMEGN